MVVLKNAPIPSTPQQTQPALEDPKPKRTGGFYDCQTIWEQELHRYRISFWTLVRVGSLIAFPYVACALGAHVYPQVVAFAEAQGLGTHKVALPLVTSLGMIVFFAYNALYGLLYHFDIEALDVYRVDDKPWHWDMDPAGWKNMLCETIGLILANFIGLTFPLMFLNSCVFGTKLRMDLDSLPAGKELFWQLMFCMVVEDFFFHHAHAALHTKYLYWIHKTHHRYHASIGIASAYAHPLEYLFGNILPSVMGPMILKNQMHIWSFGVWMIFRACAAVENHSGYEFPWSMYQAIPFKAPTEYHDFHHNRNQETYSGVLRIWDFIYGTNHHYFEWVRAGRPDTLKTQKFKEQHQIKKD